MKINRVFGILLTLILTFTLLSCLGFLMNNKKSYLAFQKMADQIDIVFLGNSHMLDSISCLDLWEDYGIASYNVSHKGYMIPESYYGLEMVYNYCTPQILVFDVYHISRMPMRASGNNGVSLIGENPNIIQRIKAAYDLSEGKKEDFIKLIFDYSIFHTRWSELNRNDFYKQPNRTRGCDHIAGCTQYKISELNRDGQLPPVVTTGMIYAEKIITLAQSKGTQVILINLPQLLSNEEMTFYNYAEYLSDKYNIPYIDFTDMDIIDYDTDLHDFGIPPNRQEIITFKGKQATDYIDNTGHLNISGQRKVTNFLGNYFVKNYAITDHRNQEDYQYWYDDLEYWKVENDNLLNANQGEFGNYFSALASGYYDCAIYIYDCDVFKNERIKRLAENIGVDVDALNHEPSVILVNKNKECNVLKLTVPTDTETIFGRTQIIDNGEGIKLLINGDIIMDIPTISDDVGCRITTYRGDMFVNHPTFPKANEWYEPHYKDFIEN